MKTIVLIFAASLAAWSQPDFNAIIAAIKASNVSAIAQQMDANVELTVGDKDGTYTKAQAVDVIAAFLSQNKPASCSLVHSGSARDGASYYCIGSLSAGGKKYRVYIFFKKTSDSYRIQEMRFELE